MKQLTDDLRMASVNLASVANVDKVINDAQTALKNYHLSVNNKKLLTTTLEKIKATPIYDLDPETVEEIDEILDEVSTVTVDANGNATLVTLTGNEHFGFTLTPSQWKRERIAGCESLIDDLTKNLKRWANQLTSKINELWISNRYTVEALKKQVIDLDQLFTAVNRNAEKLPLINIPQTINKVLSVNNRTIITHAYVDEVLSAEVNFIFNVIKVWNNETVGFKNRFIKYFGNKAKNPVNELKRPRPPFFSKKLYVDEMNMSYVYFTPPKAFIGGGAITFCEYTKPFEDIAEAAGRLEGSGYHLNQALDTDKSQIASHNITPLAFSKLEDIYNVVSKIISIIEGLNDKNGLFNISDRDVKDVLNTVRSLNDEVILDAYAAISTQYQLGVTATQTGFIKYLHTLCDKLIAFITINLEAYRG